MINDFAAKILASLKEARELCNGDKRKGNTIMPPEGVESLFTRHGRILSKLKPLQIIFPGCE
jgi:hypothetical protein